MMTTIWLALVLASPIFQSVRADEQTAAKVSLKEIGICQLVGSPEIYNGKTIIIRATYGGSIEGSIVFDQACKKTSSEDNVIALATFSSDYGRGTAIDKKFKMLLKKGFDVRLTAKATFFDGKTRVFGHLNCCRYKIEIQELITVEPAD